MIRLPNKLYRFEETVLADFVTIMRAMGEEPLTVSELHREISAAIPTEEFIDALTLLLALGRIQLDTDSGVLTHAH
ncbi:MAG: ABC-three component system middle component 7 [Propionibacteriaceae bacterium]